MADFAGTLVKFSDYPFSYSFIGLLLLASGHQLNYSQPAANNFGPIILAIGVVATTMSITDPVGNLIKFLSKKFPQRLRNPDIDIDIPHLVLTQKFRGVHVRFTELVDKSNKKYLGLQKYDRQYQNIVTKIDEDSRNNTNSMILYNMPNRSLSTNSISYEVDRVVSIAYFMVVLIALLYIIENPNFISAFVGDKGFYQDSKDLFTFIIKILLIAGVIGVGFIIFRSFERLQARITIMGTYFSSFEVFLPWFNGELELIETLGQHLSQIDGWIKELQEDDPFRIEISNLHAQLQKWRREIQNLGEVIKTSSPQILQYINIKDWGMASFFASSICRQVQDLANAPLGGTVDN